VPTLLVQGTVDTLFTLDEAVTSYRILRRNGVPAKMLWFCGGHGSCLTNDGDELLFERRTLQWLARHLQGDRSVRTGPRFEWIDQEGVTRGARDYPVGAAGELRARGSGTLPLTTAGGSGPAAGGSGAVAAVAAPTNAARALNAVNVTLPAARGESLLVGAPRVTLTYSGTGTTAGTPLYAQVVDDASGKVLGNVVTPVPVLLDGRSHTVTRPLELVAHTLRAGRTLTVQITSSATAYDPQRATGVVTIESADVALPLVDPARTAAPKAPARRGSLRIVRTRRDGRRLRVRLAGRARSVTVTVRGRGGRRIGRERVGELAGRRTATVRLRRPARRLRVVATGRAADGRALRASVRRR
jgi:ABC-2 type transport system ATP-binding protein